MNIEYWSMIIIESIFSWYSISSRQKTCFLASAPSLFPVHSWSNFIDKQRKGRQVYQDGRALLNSQDFDFGQWTFFRHLKIFSFQSFGSENFDKRGVLSQFEVFNLFPKKFLATFLSIECRIRFIKTIFSFKLCHLQVPNSFKHACLQFSLSTNPNRLIINWNAA